jgi:hypothetical protein
MEEQVLSSEMEYKKDPDSLDDTETGLFPKDLYGLKKKRRNGIRTSVS